MTELITPEEAASRLRVHRTTIFQMLKDGRLRRFKKGIGQRTYIASEDLAKLTVAHEVDTTPPAKPSARRKR